VELPATKWLPRRQDAVSQAIRDGKVQEDVASLQGVDIEVVRIRSDALLDIVEEAAAAATRAEEDRLIAAELDQGKVDAFRSELQEAHRKGRVIEHLAALSGFDVDPIESSGAGWGFFNELALKEAFVNEAIVKGFGMSGEAHGRELANEEIEAVVRCLVGQAVPVVRAPDGLVARVEHLLSVMRSAGYQPSLILIPRTWRIRESLGLPFAASDGPLRRWLAGTYDGISVLVSNSIPLQRIFAVDMAEALDVRDALGAGSPEPASVEVLPIDAERAAEIASGWSEVDDSAAAHRLRTLQQRVELRILRDFQVSVTDRLAVRSVWLPPGDRGT
jgi:hypothetical protein